MDGEERAGPGRQRSARQQDAGGRRRALRDGKELEFFVSLQKMPEQMLAAERREAQLASRPPASTHDHPAASDAPPATSVRAAARLLLSALRRRYRRSG